MGENLKEHKGALLIEKDYNVLKSLERKLSYQIPYEEEKFSILNILTYNSPFYF